MALKGLNTEYRTAIDYESNIGDPGSLGGSGRAPYDVLVRVPLQSTERRHYRSGPSTTLHMECRCSSNRYYVQQLGR